MAKKATNKETKRIHFTPARLEALPIPASGSVYVFDDSPPTLSCRVTSKGAKAYVFRGKLRGESIRLTIGGLHAWTVEAARIEANRLQTLIDKGIDPRDEAREKQEAREAKKKAREEAAAARLAEEQAQALEAQRQTLAIATAWADYCKDRTPHWSERHLKDHKTLMERGCLAPLATQPLAAIDAPRLAAWLKSQNKKRPTQAALGFRLIRAFLNWAATSTEYRDLVAPSAIDSKVLELVQKPRAKNDNLERGQLAVWFEAVQKIPNRAISAYLQVLLLSGARPGEILELKWQDVDFAWNALELKDKVEDTGRRIPLTPYVKHLLLGLKNTSQPGNDWVFQSTRAESGRTAGYRAAYYKAQDLAALPRVSLHGLRRSFGTLSEWLELPAGVVAQIMGHKPSATAEKHYRVRPLDLLALHHSAFERWILEQAGLEQPESGLSIIAKPQTRGRA